VYFDIPSDYIIEDIGEKKSVVNAGSDEMRVTVMFTELADNTLFPPYPIVNRRIMRKEQLNPGTGNI
jgi:hypothetical protein